MQVATGCTVGEAVKAFTLNLSVRRNIRDIALRPLVP